MPDKCEQRKGPSRNPQKKKKKQIHTMHDARTHAIWRDRMGLTIHYNLIVIICDGGHNSGGHELNCQFIYVCMIIERETTNLDKSL